jgi:hypothetical protein
MMRAYFGAIWESIAGAVPGQAADGNADDPAAGELFR